MTISCLAPAVPGILAHFSSVPGGATLIPLMVAVPGVMVAVFSPFAGWAADRYGRRRIVLAATVLFGFFGIAPIVFDDLISIFVSRLGIGIMQAVLLTVVNTLLGDYFDEAGRRKWLTVQGIVGPVLATLTIAAAGFLTAIDWKGAFYVHFFAFPIFVAMLLYFYEPKRQAPGVSDQQAAASKFPMVTMIGICVLTLYISIIYFVFTINGGMAFSAIGVKSSTEIGVLMSVASIAVPFGAILFGIFSKHWPAGWLVAFIMATMGAGTLGMGVTSSPAVAAAFAFIQQIGAGACVCSLVYLVNSMLPSEHRGRGMGFWVSSFFLGQFISPLVTSGVGTMMGGILGAFAVLGAVSLGSAFVVLVICRYKLAEEQT